MNEQICPSCRKRQPKQDGYCADCGTILIELRYCDTCGVAALHNGGFCRECGARLAAVVPAVVAPSAATRAALPAASALPRATTPPRRAAQRGTALAQRPAADLAVARVDPPPPTSAPLATVGGLLGTAGVVVAAFNPMVGIWLIVMMVLLANRGTNRAAAAAMDRLIDWLWEDPSMRRRLLGE